MKLQGIEFGNAFVGSGTLNFFGDGWPYHRFYRLIPGFNFTGVTLIAKTTTFHPRMPKPEEKGGKKGNLVLNPKTLQPVEMLPDCIKVRPLSGEAFNAVGLTGPGIQALLEMGRWQALQNPLVLSFMAMGDDKGERLKETCNFTWMLYDSLPGFQAPVALEENISCPNVDHPQDKLVDEILPQLEITKALGIPQGIKINVLTPVGAMKRVADSGLCDFLDIPNTLPVGKLPGRVNWKKKFRGLDSPLAKYGGGGYSGRENFELAAEWVRNARQEGVNLPIILGGVFSRDDVRAAKQAGASAISFARLAMTRPWRVASVIREAKQVF